MDCSGRRGVHGLLRFRESTRKAVHQAESLPAPALQAGANALLLARQRFSSSEADIKVSHMYVLGQSSSLR